VTLGLEAGGAAQPCAFTLCESFESVADGARPDPAVWRSGSSKIVVDSVRAFRGKQALHIPAFAGKGGYMITTSKATPAGSKKHFGRLFLWIENAPPFGKTYLHWAIVNASGRNAVGNDMQHLFGGQAYQGRPSHYLSYNSWSPMGYSGPGSKFHPTGVHSKAWQCLEWSFDTTAAPPDGRDVDVHIGCVPGYDFVDGYLASILRWGNVRYVIAAHWEDFLRPWGEDLRPVPVILSEKKLGRFVDAIEAELSTKSRGVQPHLGRAADSGPRGPNWSLPVPGETLQFRAGPRPAAPALGGAR
jgi:hypothetical protein